LTVLVRITRSFIWSQVSFIKHGLYIRSGLATYSDPNKAYKRAQTQRTFSMEEEPQVSLWKLSFALPWIVLVLHPQPLIFGVILWVVRLYEIEMFFLHQSHLVLHEGGFRVTSLHVGDVFLGISHVLVFAARLAVPLMFQKQTESE
jgi:hypothetical protein